MSGLFRDHHRVSEWEEAVERDGRAELYAVYYVPGTDKPLCHLAS